MAEQNEAEWDEAEWDEAEWDEAEWSARLKKAKNLEEVLELLKEVPPNDISSMLTDDPMSTITALEMMYKRSAE